MTDLWHAPSPHPRSPSYCTECRDPVDWHPSRLRRILHAIAAMLAAGIVR